MGIRRVTPKPTVPPPWRKNRIVPRLRNILEQLSACGSDEVVVFADESEVHLNPRPGYDWCLRGERRSYRTPGNNQRLYLALALEHGRRVLTYGVDTCKRVRLFLKLLAELPRRYRDKRRIHVVVDNAAIHKARAVREYLRATVGKSNCGSCHRFVQM